KPLKWLTLARKYYTHQH
ncbi:aspartate kinase domain protein, partial [Vibrio parahaemolyticus V-223/04]